MRQSLRLLRLFLVLLSTITPGAALAGTSAGPPWRAGVRLGVGKAFVVNETVFLEGDSLDFRCGPDDSTLRVNGQGVFPRKRATVENAPSAGTVWYLSMRDSLRVMMARAPHSAMDPLAHVRESLAGSARALIDTTYAPQFGFDRVVLKFRGDPVPTILEFDVSASIAPSDTVRVVPCMTSLAHLGLFEDAGPYVAIHTVSGITVCGGQTALRAIELLRRALSRTTTPDDVKQGETTLGLLDLHLLIHGRSMK